MRDKREEYDDIDDDYNSKTKDNDFAFSDKDPFHMGAQDLEDV